ncbi:hypothetical protein As57867_006026, partial [Aphanomyces stellatus]
MTVAPEPSVTVSVCKDATYSLQMSLGAVCGGQGCAPQGTVCPSAGNVPIQGCNPSVPSWNPLTQSCAAHENAICALVIGTPQMGGTWGCVFPSQGCQTIPSAPSPSPGSWPLFVAGDTSYMVSASSQTQLCGGSGTCAPQGSLCPSKGMPVAPNRACNASMPSWNATLNTCISPANATCAFASNVWQCQYPAEVYLTTSMPTSSPTTAVVQTTVPSSTTTAPVGIFTNTPTNSPAVTNNSNVSSAAMITSSLPTTLLPAATTQTPTPTPSQIVPLNTTANPVQPTTTIRSPSSTTTGIPSTNSPSNSSIVPSSTQLPTTTNKTSTPTTTAFQSTSAPQSSSTTAANTTIAPPVTMLEPTSNSITSTPIASSQTIAPTTAPPPSNSTVPFTLIPITTAPSPSTTPPPLTTTNGPSTPAPLTTPNANTPAPSSIVNSLTANTLTPQPTNIGGPATTTPINSTTAPQPTTSPPPTTTNATSMSPPSMLQPNTTLKPATAVATALPNATSNAPLSSVTPTVAPNVTGALTTSMPTSSINTTVVPSFVPNSTTMPLATTTTMAPVTPVTTNPTTAITTPSPSLTSSTVSPNPTPLTTYSSPTPVTSTPTSTETSNTTSVPLTTLPPLPSTPALTSGIPTMTVAPEPSVTVSVCKDATYSLQMSLGAVCGGQGCAPQGTVCPSAGNVPIQGCNPSVPSWNPLTQSCAAHENAICALVIGTPQMGGTWGCVFPSQGCQTIPSAPSPSPGSWPLFVAGDTSYMVSASSQTQLCGGSGTCAPQGSLCPSKGM